VTDIRKEGEELAKWHELQGHVENLIECAIEADDDDLDVQCNKRVLWHREQPTLLRSLLSQLPKEGEVVVPERASNRMVDSYDMLCDLYKDGHRQGSPTGRDVWEAMIAARPTKP